MTSVSSQFSLPQLCLSPSAFRSTGKIAHSKKGHRFPLPSSPQCQPGCLFKRCGVTVVWERMFMSDATRKTVLKQATQRALFRGVTFGIGWSYFWKNVWAQNAVPFIIWSLNVLGKKKVPFHGEGGTCVCVKDTVVRLAFGFKCLFWSLKAYYYVIRLIFCENPSNEISG